MRGAETKQSSMLCLMSPEARVPSGHPLRAIKELADRLCSRFRTKTRYRGLAKSRIAALMVAAAYNLLRMAKLRLTGPARHTALT